jgi:hypothetical protein
MRPIINKILKEIKFNQYILNESFDKPFNNVEKIDDLTYLCGDGDMLVKFVFRPYFKDFGCKKYLNSEPTKVYEISWDWLPDVNDENKTKSNWVKATTTSFKIIDSFNRTTSPNVIVINETENTSVIYRGDNFLEKTKTLFDNKFVVCREYDNDMDINRIFLIKKELTNYALDRINKTYEQCGGDFNLIRENILFPKKKNLKGIKLKQFKDKQIKQLLFREIYF